MRFQNRDHYLCPDLTGPVSYAVITARTRSRRPSLVGTLPTCAFAVCCHHRGRDLWIRPCFREHPQGCPLSVGQPGHPLDGQ